MDHRPQGSDRSGVLSPRIPPRGVGVPTRLGWDGRATTPLVGRSIVVDSVGGRRVPSGPTCAGHRPWTKPRPTHTYLLPGTDPQDRTEPGETLNQRGTRVSRNTVNLSAYRVHQSVRQYRRWTSTGRRLEHPHQSRPGGVVAPPPSPTPSRPVGVHDTPSSDLSEDPPQAVPAPVQVGPKKSGRARGGAGSGTEEKRGSPWVNDNVGRVEVRAGPRHAGADDDLPRRPARRAAPAVGHRQRQTRVQGRDARRPEAAVVHARARPDPQGPEVRGVEARVEGRRPLAVDNGGPPAPGARVLALRLGQVPGPVVPRALRALVALAPLPLLGPRLGQALHGPRGAGVVEGPVRHGPRRARLGRRLAARVEDGHVDDAVRLRLAQVDARPAQGPAPPSTPRAPRALDVRGQAR